MLIALAQVGCAEDTVVDTSSASAVDQLLHRVGGIPDSKQDSAHGQVLTLGDTLADFVEALPLGAPISDADPARHLRVYRVHIEMGRTVAIFMRAQPQTTLDSYLLMYTPAGEIGEQGLDQAVAPTLAPTDALIVFRAETTGMHHIFASGEGLSSGGGFHLGVYALDEKPGGRLTVSTPTLRGFVAQLRVYALDTDPLVAEGTLIEGADGLLADGASISDATVANQALARQLAARTNATRYLLFEEFIRGAGAESTAAVTAATGRTCAALWKALALLDRVL